MSLTDVDKAKIQEWAEAECESYLNDTEDQEEAISYMEMDIASECSLEPSQIDQAMDIVKEVFERL